MLWSALPGLVSCRQRMLDGLVTRPVGPGLERCRELGLMHIDLMVRGRYRSLPTNRLPFSVPDAYELHDIIIWGYPRREEWPDAKFSTRCRAGSISLLPYVVPVRPEPWEEERDRAEGLFELSIEKIVVPGMQAFLDNQGFNSSLHAVFLREDVYFPLLKRQEGR